MKPKDIYLGIDVGSTTVKAVAIDPVSDEIIWKDYQRHEAKQAEKVLEYLKVLAATFPSVDSANYRVFMTGSGGMSLSKAVTT